MWAATSRLVQSLGQMLVVLLQESFVGSFLNRQWNMNPSHRVTYLKQLIGGKVKLPVRHENYLLCKVGTTIPV